MSTHDAPVPTPAVTWKSLETDTGASCQYVWALKSIYRGLSGTTTAGSQRTSGRTSRGRPAPMTRRDTHAVMRLMMPSSGVWPPAFGLRRCRTLQVGLEAITVNPLSSSCSRSMRRSASAHHDRTSASVWRFA